MKVSIITYHDEDNYGATLQAYATYRAVNELGHTPEIINLHMKHKDSLPSKILFALKRHRFNSFRNKYMPNKTKVYTSVEELRKDPPRSDVYLVGSDQTWNPTISKEFALAYFLDFGKDTQKRVSYASSFGVSSWVDSDVAKKEKVGDLLARFSSILVREDKGVEICKEEFGLEAKQVIDPVLLFPSYPELTGEVIQSNELVVYKILNDKVFYDIASVLGSNMGCEVKSIGSLRQLKGIKTSYPEKIEKWIANIASAKYVFTDSFHGTVLALLYHRQFVVYVGYKNKMSRITSLLGMLGLTDRILSKDDSTEAMVKMMLTPIDYTRVDEVLNKKRLESMCFLRDELE